MTETTAPMLREGASPSSSPTTTRTWGASSARGSCARYYMPVLSAEHVLERIRSDESLSTLPVLVVSAAGKHARDSALASGADSFLDKPLRLLDLVNTVRTLLHLHES